MVLPWRPVLVLLGMVGLVAGAAIFALTPRFAADTGGESAARESAAQGALPGYRRLAFPVLISIGMIDSATRSGFLLFLPFVLTAKGASLPTVGLALTLVFAGGAAGKLICAFIGARIGAMATVWLSEGLTAALILALLPLASLRLHGSCSTPIVPCARSWLRRAPSSRRSCGRCSAAATGPSRTSWSTTRPTTS